MNDDLKPDPDDWFRFVIQRDLSMAHVFSHFTEEIDGQTWVIVEERDANGTLLMRRQTRADRVQG